MTSLPAKLKWGSTKYLKVGSLYLLRDTRCGFFPLDSFSAVRLPQESYMLYLGHNTVRNVTCWQFFHLGLQMKIEAGNRGFASHILEVAEPA